MNKYEKRDFQKYYVRNPVGFSPERNKYIIDKTIQEYETGLARRKKKHEDAIAERIDATASYLMWLERGGGTQAERYFGKKELARLRGKRIVETIMDEKSKMLGLSDLDNDVDFVY